MPTRFFSTASGLKRIREVSREELAVVIGDGGSRCDAIAQVFFQKLGLLFITLGKPVKRFSAKKIQRNRLSMAQKIQVVAPIPPFRFCKARPFRVFREVEPQFSFLVSCPQTDEFVNQGGAGE